MKPMRALLLSSMLFVLVMSLILIYGVRGIPEFPLIEKEAQKAILVSSGGSAAAPVAAVQNADTGIAPVSLINPPVKEGVAEGGAVEQIAQPAQAALEAQPVSQPAQPGQDLQMELSKSFQPWDAPFTEFAGAVENGLSGQVVGIYVPGVMELQVLQQPPSDALYVSSQTGTATQFERAAENGVIGLLAHNTSSGILFYQINVGEQIEVVYGDGNVERFQVQSINEFQKLNTTSPMSDFVDLTTGGTLTSTEVFNRFYSGGRHLTLQTCLERNGDPNWGLRFIEAYRVN